MKQEPGVESSQSYLAEISGLQAGEDVKGINRQLKSSVEG
jgi:hypothetical protein